MNERIERLQLTIANYIENANHALQFSGLIDGNCLRHELSNYCYIFDELQEIKKLLKKD